MLNLQGQEGCMILEIEGIHKLCTAHEVEWTIHVAKRLLQRGISANDIDSTILSGEIIEEYPEDFPYPSCLIMGKTAMNRTLHVVCAIGDEKLWIITAYEPNTAEWETDFQTRRRES